VIPVALALSSGRAYYLVRPKRGGDRPQIEAFSRWLKMNSRPLIGQFWTP
jgi:hypothetical protein